MTFVSDHADGGRVEKRKESADEVVKTIDFNTFLKANDDITFLNMDIEGAEDTVFFHCIERMVRIPFLFIEYHSFSNREQIIGSILHSLEKNGYRIHLRHELSSTSPFVDRVERNGMDMQINIFAKRTSK